MTSRPMSIKGANIPAGGHTPCTHLPTVSLGILENTDDQRSWMDLICLTFCQKAFALEAAWEIG
jgi:hypothetical protein